MKLPEDFIGDVHGLVQRFVEVADRVYLNGDGNPMPTVEANAVGRDKAIREAGDTIGDALGNVATALNRIADEIMHARRSREASRVSNDATS